MGGEYQRLDYDDQIILNLQKPTNPTLNDVEKLTEKNIQTVQLPTPGATSRFLYLEGKANGYQKAMVDLPTDHSKLQTDSIKIEGKDTRIYIIGHGSPGCTSLKGDAPKGEQGPEYTAKELATIIANGIPEGSDVKNYRISLIACYAGVKGKNGEPSFARNLFDELAPLIAAKNPKATLEIVGRMGAVARRTQNTDHSNVDGKVKAEGDMVMITGTAESPTETVVSYRDNPKGAFSVAVSDKDSASLETSIQASTLYENVDRAAATASEKKIVLRLSSHQPKYAVTFNFESTNADQKEGKSKHYLISVDTEGYYFQISPSNGIHYATLADLETGLRAQYDIEKEKLERKFQQSPQADAQVPDVQAQPARQDQQSREQAAQEAARAQEQLAREAARAREQEQATREAQTREQAAQEAVRAQEQLARETALAREQDAAREQQAREQQAREQQAREQQAREQQAREREAPEQAAQQAREAAAEADRIKKIAKKAVADRTAQARQAQQPADIERIKTFISANPGIQNVANQYSKTRSHGVKTFFAAFGHKGRDSRTTQIQNLTTALDAVTSESATIASIMKLKETLVDIQHQIDEEQRKNRYQLGKSTLETMCKTMLKSLDTHFSDVKPENNKGGPRPSN